VIDTLAQVSATALRALRTLSIDYPSQQLEPLHIDRAAGSS
jgi:hypothetical protein